MSIFYFAYGSCMDKKRLKRHEVLQEFEVIGIGRIDGWRFRMNKLSSTGQNVWANVEKDHSSHVYGILYQISEIGHRYLDIRENFPEHYRKEFVTVNVGKQVFEDVMMYQATPEHISTEKCPTTMEYAEELKRGGASLPEPYRSEIFLKEIERCFS
ncbi:gamma-glutamylcyclotransferase [Heliorestis acidaminivorans]|uniref:Gamma-glutamylcyclotransferase n=1 Tax=Heliorestis acidaminivorans TaxID=553427 RepID=A0A6I0F3F0_9FIRM|nr:gamma-glutamylcyclotransferase family protein [Heliorestis acidaminivorans]KAB2954270.1 gamma-glutamylcyclotransferase [Heliorestis acidaminivorans]